MLVHRVAKGKLIYTKTSKTINSVASITVRYIIIYNKVSVCSDRKL